MKHDKIKFYLKNNLESPSLEFKWTDKYNEQFFIFIKENTSETFLHDKENLLVIRESFATYFEQIGNILFKIKNNQIRLKILPHSQDEKDSKHIDKITNIVDENKDSINTAYNGKEDQIYINNDLREKIFSYIKTIEDEETDTKELVRSSVRKALELKDEDLIMLKKDCIFVKLCDISKKLSITKEGFPDRRFNGIDEEEMSDFHKEHFSSEEKKSFFYISAKMFVDLYFLEKNINNHDYEKKVFSLVQLIIAEQLMNKFADCEEFFKGFAGYIFRRNFQAVFEYISELVLHEISISNYYMIDFLKYYSLNIIVINGKKYRTPSLETDDNLRWNVISMLSIVRVYLKKKLVIKNIQYDIDEMNAQIMNLCISGLSPVEYNSKNTDDKNKLINTLISYERSIENCYDSLIFAKNQDAKEELLKQIEFTKQHAQELKKEKKELLNKAVNRSDINKFIALEKDVASTTRRLDKESKILNQNKDSFDSIQKALTKALISKKQLVS